jgi:hypothetical protein
LEAETPRVYICAQALLDMIDISNITGTILEYQNRYESDCPEPFIELDANNLRVLYDSLEKGGKYAEYKKPLHTAANALSIIIVLVQLFCVYKIYWDYGYVIFRNEGASIEKRCKFVFDLKAAILLRIQSFLTILKVYGFFSIALFLNKLSISIMVREFPTLAILYGVATLLGSFAGYYGFRNLNYYLSSFHIIMIISQMVGLGFMYVAFMEHYESTNYRWNFSLLSAKFLINTYILVNAIWCILDFPSRSKDDSNFFILISVKFINKKASNLVHPEVEKTRFLID